MKTRRWAMGTGVVVLGAMASGVVALPASGAGQNGDPGDKMVNDPAAPVLGNPMGRVTMAEFFDYRCTYCRSMLPVLRELLARRTDVRLVMREWPVFGGISVYAAKVALAANWQGKFAPVHAALFELSGSMTEASIRQAVEKAGVDLARMDRDLAARAGELDTVIGDNTVMARSLGFQGTPGFIVGRYKAPGVLTLEQIEGMITQSAKQS